MIAPACLNCLVSKGADENNRAAASAAFRSMAPKIEAPKPMKPKPMKGVSGAPYSAAVARAEVRQEFT